MLFFSFYIGPIREVYSHFTVRKWKFREARRCILEKAMAPHSSTLAWKIPWMEEPGGLPSMGVAKSRTWLRDFTFTFHFPALEKEMATHSSVLAWRITGTGEPGGLPSMGSHRVGHDWSDLAAAAAASAAGDVFRWHNYKEVIKFYSNFHIQFSFYNIRATLNAV